MNAGVFGQGRWVVAPFKGRNDPPLASGFAPLEDRAREGFKPIRAPLKPPEGIPRVPVEAGGDEEEVRGEVIQLGVNLLSPEGEEIRVRGPGWERAIEGEAGTCAYPPLFGGAGSWVEGRLMNAHEEDVVAVIEKRLGAVAVVDVPI